MNALRVDAGSIIGSSESCYNLLINDIQSIDRKIREEGLRILTDLLHSSRGIRFIAFSFLEARDLYASREIEDLLLPYLKEDSTPEETIQAIQPLDILLEDNNIQTLQRMSHKEEILETLINLVFVILFVRCDVVGSPEILLFPYNSLFSQIDDSFGYMQTLV